MFCMLPDYSDECDLQVSQVVLENEQPSARCTCTVTEISREF